MKPKSLKRMKFEELVDELTWYVIQNIIHGAPLRGIVFYCCNVALQWKETHQ